MKTDSYKAKYRALLAAYAKLTYEAADSASATAGLFTDPFMMEAIRLGIWSPPGPPAS